MSDGPSMFPFDIPTGPEFIAIYTLLAMIALLLSKGAQHVFLELTDPARPEDEAPRSGTAHRPLTVGHFPRPDEIPDVAFIRGGSDALADTLLARAIAEGWLVPAKDRGFDVEDPNALAVPASHALKRRLPHGHATYAEAQKAALGVARAEEEARSKKLVAAGLIRSGGRLALGTMVHAAFGVALLVIGAVRASMGEDVNRPIAFLFLEMAGIAGAFALLARPRRTTSGGARYLSWLTDATTSLRAEVRERRATRNEDVALAAAVEGISSVPALASRATRKMLDGETAPVVSNARATPGNCGSGGQGGGGCGS